MQFRELIEPRIEEAITVLSEDINYFYLLCHHPIHCTKVASPVQSAWPIVSRLYWTGNLRTVEPQVVNNISCHQCYKNSVANDVALSGVTEPQICAAVIIAYHAF